MRLLLISLLASSSISYAKVEFTYSTMYDTYDIPGGAEIPLPRCDSGCLIFASIQGLNNLDQYLREMIINDSVNGKIKSVAEVATQYHPTTWQKLPLAISINGRYSIKNFNAPATVPSDVTIWVIDAEKAQRIDYEIYDAAAMYRKADVPKSIVTIMSASRFTVYADKGPLANPYTAWQAGFDNALDNNPDRCEYVVRNDDAYEFDGFTFQVDAPIISFVFKNQRSVVLKADYNFFNLRLMTKVGFLTSPGYNGCDRVGYNQVHWSTSYHPSDQIDIHGEPLYYQMDIDAISNLDQAHQIDVMDLTNRNTIEVVGMRNRTQISLQNAQIVSIYYHDMKAPQSFLFRYTTTLIGRWPQTTTAVRSSTSTTSTVKPTTSTVGVAMGVAAFVVVLTKLIALREHLQNH